MNTGAQIFTSSHKILEREKFIQSRVHYHYIYFRSINSNYELKYNTPFISKEDDRVISCVNNYYWNITESFRPHIIHLSSDEESYIDRHKIIAGLSLAFLKYQIFNIATHNENDICYYLSQLLPFSPPEIIKMIYNAQNSYVLANLLLNSYFTILVSQELLTLWNNTILESTHKIMFDSHKPFFREMSTLLVNSTYSDLAIQKNGEITVPILTDKEYDKLRHDSINSNNDSNFEKDYLNISMIWYLYESLALTVQNRT